MKSLIKSTLMKRQDRKYEKTLSDKSVTYEHWVTAKELSEANDDFDIVHTEGYVLLMASKGSPSESAARECNELFRERPEIQLIYGDEDVRRTHSPWYKPAWSPDTFDTTFYFGSLVAVREALFEETCQVYKRCHEDCFPRVFREHKRKGWKIYEVADVERYMKWMSICVELAGGYQKHCESIHHLSRIVFRSEDKSEQLKFLKKAKARQIPYLIPKGAQVSVIIPSKDNPDLLHKAMDSCKAKNLEFIIVDNGSSEENRDKIQKLLKDYPASYIYEDMEFNFAKMCNIGAQAAQGAYLLFLNDDVEFAQPETMEVMMGMAGRPYTGAVGLKLFYPESCKIQHVGITNLPMGPVHKLQFKEDENQYYGSNRGKRNVLAVTGACLMIEKAKFEEVGGFCEELPIAFNDVDLCFTLYEAGYQNVCINDHYGYHHESVSRGADESAEKLERLWGERDKLYARHPKLQGVDPYYSKYLNRTGLDTTIRPVYVTAKNETQIVDKKIERASLSEFRQDDCLMFRLEDGRNNHFVGYGVVLGDDNACYEKKLVLKAIDAETYVEIPLQAQYRPDLQENMKDQKNVALSGYDVEIPEGLLSPGKYLVGMTARNRVTGLKLINWSKKSLELR